MVKIVIFISTEIEGINDLDSNAVDFVPIIPALDRLQSGKTL